MEQGIKASGHSAVRGLIYITVVILPALLTYLTLKNWLMPVWITLLLLIPFVFCILFLWYDRKRILENESVLVVRPHAVVLADDSIYILANVNNIFSINITVDFFYEIDKAECFLFSGYINGITTHNDFQIVPDSSPKPTHHGHIKKMIFENDKKIFKSVIIKPRANYRSPND